jgi:hypothetical protein
MSKNLPQQQQSEEVDLGQLFKLIGNMFDRLFRFIGSVFYKLFLIFVWFVFFVKKHFIKLVIAGAVGTGLSIFQQKTSDPVYKSYITVKQNYNTGENLYNAIAYYNDLVGQNDIKTLKHVLEIDTLDLSSILGFDIESVISENDKLKNYNDYLTELDSTIAATIDYKTYIKNSKDYNHEYQQITIKSKDRKNFKVVFDKVIENIESNEYFKKERRKDSVELNHEKQVLNEALDKSDSLQSTYKRVLESTLNTQKGSEIGITFEGANDKDKTKEFELYKSDLELRQRIVEIDREIADKSQIIETISSKQDSGSVDNSKELLGLSISGKIFYGIIFTVLTFFVLLGLQFVKYLERFRDKV